MTAALTTPPRALAVWFKDLHRWDCGFYKKVAWQWPHDYLHPVGSVLHRKKIEVPATADKKGLPIIEKITFGGLISLSDPEERIGYKGKLFWANRGDLIYSKIRVKQGSLAVVPDEFECLAVSSEYPVYSINKQHVDSTYLALVLKSKPFLSLFESLSHGGSTKTRIPPAEFERQLIPLPPLHQQRAIVSHWSKAQESEERAQSDLFASSNKLDAALHKITNFQALETPMLTLYWSDLEQWDVKSARAAAFRLANPTFLPLSQYAEEVTEIVKPWEEPKKEWPVYGVNNREGVFFSHFQKGDEFNAPYKRIRTNWFFHNPTRSSVGSLGIVPEVPEDAITSPEYQVWRVRPGGEWEPEFVAALVRTAWFVKLIQVHRVGAVKQRLYVENLLSMPMPPIPQNIRNEAAKQRLAALVKVAKSRQASKTANDEVEALILGTKKVSEL